MTGLGLHESSRTLRATTHGRSVWDLNVASLLPIPTIATVSPSTVTADTSSAKLTVTGYQFTSKSIVTWNGSPLKTTYVSGSEVSAAVPASDLLKSESASVEVLNGTGGKLSNKATVTVVNPKPTLTALSKTSATAGSAGFTLTVTGTNFVPTSKIDWQGRPLTTTYKSATSLSAAIPASDLAKAATVSVTVVNPTPGGGTSSSIAFKVN